MFIENNDNFAIANTISLAKLFLESVLCIPRNLVMGKDVCNCTSWLFISQLEYIFIDLFCNYN